MNMEILYVQFLVLEEAGSQRILWRDLLFKIWIQFLSSFSVDTFVSVVEMSATLAKKIVKKNPKCFQMSCFVGCGGMFLMFNSNWPKPLRKAQLLMGNLSFVMYLLIILFSALA